MSEKRYTAKQATLAVLDKVRQLLKKSEQAKIELKKTEQGSELTKDFENLSVMLKGMVIPSAAVAGQHGTGKGMHPDIKERFGTSTVGHHVRQGDTGKAKKIMAGAKKLGVWDSPTPNLPKSEDSMEKAEQGFQHADTHAGHDIHVGQTGGKWAHQLFQHGKGFVHGSNSGAIFDSKEKAIEGAKAKLKLKKSEDSLEKSEKPKGEIMPNEKEAGPPDGTRTQTDPMKNPKEKAEGNNELAGTTPTQVGQDGKNLPGFDEMRGHIKLAKFIGMMEAKRKAKKVAAPMVK